MPFTRCCNDGPPPDLQGWDPCSPLDIGDVTIGDITVDVDFTPVIDKLCEIEVLLQDLEVTADGQTQFGCVCDAAGEFQGWVFTVTTDDVVSLGLVDETGAWTPDWSVPTGWVLGGCPTKDEPNPDVPVIAPCSGCVDVDGVVDPLAFAVNVGGVSTWFTVTVDGAVPITGTVTVLDECDPRCLPACCDVDLDFECDVCEEDCDCSCGPADLAAAAQAIGEL